MLYIISVMTHTYYRFYTIWLSAFYVWWHTLIMDSTLYDSLHYMNNDRHWLYIIHYTPLHSTLYVSILSHSLHMTCIMTDTHYTPYTISTYTLHYIPPSTVTYCTVHTIHLYIISMMTHTHYTPYTIYLHTLHYIPQSTVTYCTVHTIPLYIISMMTHTHFTFYTTCLCLQSLITHDTKYLHGVAVVIRIDYFIGLFCRIQSLV